MSKLNPIIPALLIAAIFSIAGYAAYPRLNAQPATQTFSVRLTTADGSQIYSAAGNIILSAHASDDPQKPTYIMDSVTFAAPTCWVHLGKCDIQIPDTVNVLTNTNVEFSCWHATKQGPDYSVPVPC